MASLCCVCGNSKARGGAMIGCSEATRNDVGRLLHPNNSGIHKKCDLENRRFDVAATTRIDDKVRIKCDTPFFNTSNIIVFHTRKSGF